MKTKLPYIELPIKTYSALTESLLDEKKQVINEHMLELFINEERWMTFICSPTNLEELALGFIWNENIITDLNQVNSVVLSENLSKININLKIEVERPTNFHRTTTGITLPNKKNFTQPILDYSFPVKDLSALYSRFSDEQKLHDLVGGFHSAGLSDGQQIYIIMEDLGRHNCLDKLAGGWLLYEQKFSPSILMISGRISSEMVMKSLFIGSRILISRTTPTALAIQIAEKAGMCLVGYMRSRQFNVYSHPEYLS
jgi:FdhD protein